MNTTFGSILSSKIKLLLNSLHIQYFFCTFAIRKHMFHPKTIENMIITILVLLSTVAMFIIGKIRADGFALRHLFHHIVADNVYQQHCNGSADGTYSHECRHGTQCKSVGIPLCSNSWCQHVFCLTVFHTSQCACHASRRLYLWRLC